MIVFAPTFKDFPSCSDNANTLALPVSPRLTSLEVLNVSSLSVLNKLPLGMIVLAVPVMVNITLACVASFLNTP